MQTTSVLSQGSVDDATSQEVSGVKKGRFSSHFDSNDDGNGDKGSFQKVMIEFECGNDYCGLQADSSNPPSLKAC